MSNQLGPTLADCAMVNEAQKILLLLGRKRFGEPDAAQRATLDAITNLDRLEALSERLLEATSWQDLLQT